MSIEAALKLEQFADLLVLGLDWSQEPDRTVYTITTNNSDGWTYVMPEQLYTYRRVRDASGRESYERVPYDSSAPTLEDPVTVPRLAPAVRNGEQPGQGSLVVDELLRRTYEAAARRLAEEQPKAPSRPAPDITKPRRLIEP
jgi:hypothetical protein